MSETKINLDAFLKRNAHGDDNQPIQESISSESAEKTASNAVKSLGISSAEKISNTENTEVKPLAIKKDEVSEEDNLSINQEIEAWLEAVHEEIEEIKPIEAPIQEESHFSDKKHSLSLDSLVNKPIVSETEDTEVSGAPEMHEEVIQESQVASNNNQDEKELFWNYESKFSTQSTKILQRLRMPKTRVGMLAWLAMFSVVIIGALMYINPETHSISNYKASIKTIYNDIKSWSDSKESESWPTWITGEIEDISRRDNIQTQDTTESLPVEEPRKKEEIKKENLKNFLLENYK